MKNKDWKITSTIMTIICLLVTINNAQIGHLPLTTIWGVATVIWAYNIKLYWNE